MLKRSILATAILAAFATPSTFAESSAGAFIDDATIGGGVYNLTRIRDRQPNGSEHFAENIHHSTMLANIDFTSGLVGGVFGADVGIYGTYDLWDSGSSQWSEMSLVKDGKIKDGVSVYKGLVKAQYEGLRVRAGYLQPSGPGVLGVNWSYLPGTYQGGEAVYSADNLSVAYMIANQYKNPWTYDLEKMKRKDGTNMKWVQSVGASYNLDNGISLLDGYGAGDDFIDLYKLKVAKGGEGYNASYQFYAMDDKDNKEGSDNNIFDGLTYQHVLTSSFNKDNWTFRVEGTYTKSKGAQGNFAFRPTGYNGGFGKSNGAYEVWWDSRSDFNHNGEKAVFVGAWYDFADGWRAGASYAYGWDGKSSDTALTTEKLKERAYNLDVGYTFQSGHLKGANVKAHYTIYDLVTDVNSWSSAYPNAFRDERDLKLSFVMPFSF